MTNGEPLAGPSTRESWLNVVVATFLVIAAIVIAVHVHGLASQRMAGPDDSLYASEAARWLAGRPLTTMSDEPAVVRPPVYVLALATATGLTGDWQLSEPIVAAVGVFAAVIAAGAIAWALGGSLAAVLSVAIFLVPGMVDAFARSAIDGLQAALVLAAVAVAVGLAARRQRWGLVNAVVVGVLLGLAVLTKETALALAPLPFAVAATQPAATLTPAIRWAGMAGAALVATLLPWWLWVDLAVGRFFPTHFGGIVADIAVAGFAAIGVAALCLVSNRVSGTAGRLVGRVSEGARWWLTVAACVVWAVAIVGAFLSSDARHALPRLPALNAALVSFEGLSGLLLFPVVAIGASIVALFVATRWPLLRGLVLLQLLTAGLVVIVVLKGWDPRSAVVPAIAIGLLLPVAAGRAAGAISRITVPGRRLAATAGLVAIVLVVLSTNLVGLVQAAQNPPTPPESQKWNGPIVEQAAAWLEQRLEPGQPVVASWLFATSLDAMTEARYRIVETPTLQARIGRTREPILVPTGTLFRENARLPKVVPNDWLFVRRHPTEGYLVGLSGTLLSETIRSSGARYLVLSGEHPAQSTTTIADDLAGWPGLREATRFRSGDAEIVIMEIDQSQFALGPFATNLNAAFVRDWPALVRAGRRGVDPGTALCELLEGRALDVVPDDDRTQALLAEILPIGCPVPVPVGGDTTLRPPELIAL